MFKRLFTVLLFFLLSKPVFAQTEFLTDYIVNYTVKPDGLTHAELNITLTNQLSNIYAKEFTLTIGSTELSNILVTDNNDELFQPQVITGTKTTNITVSFPQKVLGKDKAQIFNLKFDSADFSHRLGNVWEISIPKFTKTDNLKTYQLTLSVPLAFGPVSTITPNPISVTNNDQFVVYRFNPADLFEKGISATFGQIQYFNFNLNYHLQNNNLFPVKTAIALPPDTAWQTVLYQTLEPQPENITVDSDGNWLANYLLTSKQSLKIIASGSAELYLEPKNSFLSTLNSSVNYLSSQKYWETTNPRIVKLAQELVTPKKIYQYLVDNLIYDYGRISDNTTRFGAANALDSPTSAICTEFTDLFVALTRAANIPSRAINGYAYTTNPGLRPLSLKGDILHAWSEYFDREKNLWIPVDPTWGNTTGGVDFFNRTDLNHLTFVILGKDSQYPIPAGGYKTNPDQTKDVSVEFGSPLTHQPETSLQIRLPHNALAGTPIRGEIILTNTGNIALYNQTVKLTTNRLKPTVDFWEIPALPPQSHFTIPFELPASSWTQNFVLNLEAASQFSSIKHSLTIKPIYSLSFINKTFLLWISGLIFLIAIFLLLKKIIIKPKI
ncbi:MAG: transglutaminase-like domain-containing protein [Candidatus Beckwithbacteria bacterium]|nr:transglutaminase-like domain-containing protein [Candidatus Beckwithbacteria bacterium]